MTASESSLHVHEWVAILVIVNVLAVLTLVTRFSEPVAQPAIHTAPHYVADQKIEIFVEGAVEQPVRLIVNKGTTVEDVLKQVRLLPEADISKLKKHSKVRRGQHIRIPLKKKRA